MGLGGGFTALGLGLAGLLGKGPLRGEVATGAATFYGVTALATAIWSLLFPVKKGEQTAAAPKAKAVAARPPVRVVKSEAKAAPKTAEKPQVRISRVGAAETAKVAREEAQFM